MIHQSLIPSRPSVHVIAGANGSGKTTFARVFLPRYIQCERFVNADLIAQGLSPFAPNTVALRASKLALQEINRYSNMAVSFGFETTLSGKQYGVRLQSLKNRGYQIQLYFLWVPSPELAISRITERVQLGGHFVPSDDVRRRYKRGLSQLFSRYLSLADGWMIFDNSQETPSLIAHQQDGTCEVLQPRLFDDMKERATTP